MSISDKEDLQAEISHLTKAIENDKWPILLRGDWIWKEKCLDLLIKAENALANED
jgi:hypothetical protein